MVLLAVDDSSVVYVVTICIDEANGGTFQDITGAGATILVFNTVSHVILDFFSQIMWAL